MKSALAGVCFLVAFHMHAAGEEACVCVHVVYACKGRGYNPKYGRRANHITSYVLLLPAGKTIKVC